MKTAEDLKNQLIEYLYNLDKSTLSMAELGGYVFIVKQIAGLNSSGCVLANIFPKESEALSDG